MKYWVYLQGEVPGSFTPEELGGMPDVEPSTLVCPAEGEILEKNWRQATEFPELAAVLRDRAAKTLPASGVAGAGVPPPLMTGGGQPASEKPVPAPDPSDRKPQDAGSDVERFLDTSSSKLFRHVSELMRELEVRRDERSLVSSLQRQIAELKEALQKTREKAAILEDRMAVVPTLDESVRKNEIHIHGLEDSLKKSETSHAELHVKYETCRMELENAKRRLTETSNDLNIRNRLVERLNKEMTEKDLALAKALAVIRRFEEEMGRICPETGDIQQAEAPRQPALPLQHAPAPEPVTSAPPALSLPVASAEAKPAAPEPSVPRQTFTTDEPPAAPPPLEPQAPKLQPEAQNALARFLKKYFSIGGQYH